MTPEEQHVWDTAFACAYTTVYLRSGGTKPAEVAAAEAARCTLDAWRRSRSRRAPTPPTPTSKFYWCRCVNEHTTQLGVCDECGGRV